MSALPQVGFRQAGTPQSPFYSTTPVAPLFVRDRYGSADSIATTDSIDKETQQPVDENPWTDGAGIRTVEESSSELSSQTNSSEANLPPVDTGIKAWSILAGAFLFEALIWGMCICPMIYTV